MYHQILPSNELNNLLIQPGMYVTEKVFNKQIYFLQSHFQIISFLEFLQRWHNNEWDANKRYCVITFDDGWRDNYAHAYPILERYQVPATIFLTTSFIGTNDCFWPNRLSHLLNQSHPISPEETYKVLSETAEEFGLYKTQKTIKLLKANSHNSLMKTFDILVEATKTYPEHLTINFIKKVENLLKINPPNQRLMLNWAEIEEMSAQKISFGSHGCTHRLLTHLSTNEIQHEIQESQRTLTKRKINYVPIFCYPNGDYNMGIAKMVSNTEYQAAVTTRFGANKAGQENLYALNRIGIHNDISNTVPLFSLHLSGLLKPLSKLSPGN
jgi:peptidoglycan/xylan/chitin deacetylase (PgdA/CDA1 family)